MIGLFKHLIIGYCLLVITICAPQISAESLSVSLRVGDTRISFTGYTSPSAFVTIKQNNVVVGTTLADSSGAFTKELDAYNPGVQSYTLHATDTNNLVTPTLTYDVNLTPNTLTTIDNIVFPPTVVLNSTTNTLSGLSHPLSTLTLILSDSSTYTITVLPSGAWSFDLDTLSGGSYTAYLIATMPGNIISLESETISFSVASVSTSSPTPTSITSSSTSPSSSPSSSPSTIITASPSQKTGTPTPSPSLTPSPLTTFFVTIAKPVSMIYLFTAPILILFILRLLFFKKKKKKKKN